MSVWRTNLQKSQKDACHQSNPENIGEIAKQFGVANILDGSAQQATDQLWRNLRLVNAQSDSHLRARTYDRKLTDIFGVQSEENLALIQTIFGENSLAVSTLARLLQTPYNSGLYGGAVVTAALLRPDPLWDSLGSDPAFQKLCEEK
jgi:hypothetical protein